MVQRLENIRICQIKYKLYIICNIFFFLYIFLRIGPTAMPIRRAGHAGVGEGFALNYMYQLEKSWAASPGSERENKMILCIRHQNVERRQSQRAATPE